MNDENLEQLKQNLTKMKAYMDDLTPKNATLANNAAWKWIHKSMGTCLELFEPEVVEPKEEKLDFPLESTPDSKPETDPLPDPEKNELPDDLYITKDEIDKLALNEVIVPTDESVEVDRDKEDNSEEDE